MSLDDPYVRLLRWYPNAWRETHGAVFLDTLRELSEHEGRSRPSRGESFAAMVNGIGTRLDARLATTLALAAITLRAVLQISAETFTPSGMVDAAWNGVIVLCFGTVTLLVLPALTSLARTYGLLTPGRAVAVLALGVTAMAVYTCASCLWAVGLQLAPDNQTLTGPGTAAGPLCAAAAVLGLAAGWLVMDSALNRARLPRLPRFVLSALAGAVLTAVVGYATFMQLASVSVAVVVGALALRSLGVWPVRPTNPKTSTPRYVRPLAAVAAGIGIVAITYAVTGAAWSPAAQGEMTIAGSQGILALLIGVLFLVAALGLLAASQGRRPVDVWGPAALASIAIGAVFFAYTDAPLSSRAEPALTIGSASLGLAIAWWVTARVERSARDRWVAGALITVTLLAYNGAALLPVAVFLTPLIAVVLAVRGYRRRGGVRTIDPANAPVAGA